MSKKFIYGQYNKEEQLALDCFTKAYTGVTSVSEYNPTNYGTYYDVWAKNRNGEVEHIELKLRKENTDRFKTCFIEVEKWSNLLRDYRDRPEHPKPIYINFIGNEKNVYIWDLSKVKSASFHPNIMVDGEIVDRIGLRWEDAWHFTQEEDGKYKTIKRGLN